MGLVKLSNLQSRLAAIRAVCSLLQNKRNSLKTEVIHIEKLLSVVSNLEIQSTEAAQVLKRVAEICELSSKQVMEKIINHGLKAIFEETDTFSVEMETKARSVYAYMRLGEDSKTNIIDSRGGGYVDIISVLTVIVLILQQRKDMQRFLVLDEAFAEVGREHLEKVGQFLRFLVEKLGITILLITHSEELLPFANNIYDASIQDGITKMKKREIKNGTQNSDSWLSE
jgi:ABC-type dipeptide/oligopeptide/nickel transport system ATPase subunit